MSEQAKYAALHKSHKYGLVIHHPLCPIVRPSIVTAPKKVMEEMAAHYGMDLNEFELVTPEEFMRHAKISELDYNIIEFETLEEINASVSETRIENPPPQNLRRYIFALLKHTITGIFCLIGLYLILYYFTYHQIPAPWKIWL